MTTDGQTRSGRGASAGFTLIELLVVNGRRRVRSSSMNGYPGYESSGIVDDACLQYRKTSNG